MTKREKARAYLIKQRDIEIQMMADMENYMKRDDPKYSKIKFNHIEKINLIDYILMKV